MSNSKKYSQPEVIAMHFGWDISEARDSIYQAGHTGARKVYTCDGDYYCCSKTGADLWKERTWEHISDPFVEKTTGYLIFKSKGTCE